MTWMTLILNNYIMYFKITKIIRDIVCAIRSLIKLKLCHLSTYNSSVKYNIFYALKCDTNILLK